MRGSRAFTRAELARLIAATDRLYSQRVALRHNTMLVVMASTGLRAGEACQLRVGDVSRGGRALASIYVRKRTTKGKLSGAQMPINDYCREWLGVWLRYSGLGQATADTPLWPPARGGHGERGWYQLGRSITYAGLAQVLRRTIAAAGLDGHVSSHGLRKYFAARIWEITGHDLLAAKAALRHHNIGNTLYYLDVGQEGLTTALRSVL